ncbi:MAG: hypothetical protein KDK27_17375, partial [Leptospiraceae bacterium]|nr:hypothetical protein [Leptospiraceae bacterium]
MAFLEKKLGFHNFDVRELRIEPRIIDFHGRAFVYLDQPFDFDDLDKRKVDYKRYNPETDSDGVSSEEASKILA